MAASIDEWLEWTRDTEITVVNWHSPNVDADKEEEIGELVHGKHENVHVVWYALEETINGVECMAGKWCGDLPLVVRLVYCLVDGLVVEATVDPVDQAVGEEDEGDTRTQNCPPTWKKDSESVIWAIKHQTVTHHKLLLMWWATVWATKLIFTNTELQHWLQNHYSHWTYKIFTDYKCTSEAHTSIRLQNSSVNYTNILFLPIWSSLQLRHWILSLSMLISSVSTYYELLWVLDQLEFVTMVLKQLYLQTVTLGQSIQVMICHITQDTNFPKHQRTETTSGTYHIWNHWHCHTALSNRELLAETGD